jgi:S-adenosylmethionine:tRNA ribosyltransferase-isomerase
LVVVSERPSLLQFAALPQLLRAGDLLIVNDAATLPASLYGTTADGEALELRLSAPVEAGGLRGVLFGAGDHRTRTEDRPAPPLLVVGDVLRFGGSDGFDATIVALEGRTAELTTMLDDDALWQGLYRSGAPVQYAHRAERLPLYAVQTAYASRPWAVEMPSAGRPLTWELLLGLRRAGVALATLTHAAGLSSTGDADLDRALPLPERYELPQRTIDAIRETRARGGRIIAVGTSVVRALESTALTGALRAGVAVATLRLDARSTLRIVDGLISGLHVPGESHFELLLAFAPRDRLERALALALDNDLSAHELGDACLILRA